MVHEEIATHGHEQVTHFADEETGLRAIVAVHDTTLGPSLGGTRMLPYESNGAALRDALRLSRAMTYKAAAADLELGGGKAVIVGDPEVKTGEMMRAYGRAVQRLCGRYITSVDMNTDATDMDAVATETEYVTALSDGLGDPSPVTAQGAFAGIEACVEAVYGTTALDGRSVAVQGLGKVGRRLTERLVGHGAEVTVTDVDESTVRSVADEYGVSTVPPEDIYDVSCDIFAPCAIGGVINDDTIPRLDCDVVAGAANNVLESREHARALHDRGVLCAPDYVLNAGGLITVATEYEGGTMGDALAAAEAIGDRVRTLVDRADEQDRPVVEVADEYAEERIETAGAEAELSA